ncbi:hypothetical protein H4R24_005316, partial [Coemansia sp. RSA 988]
NIGRLVAQAMPSYNPARLDSGAESEEVGAMDSATPMVVDKRGRKFTAGLYADRYKQYKRLLTKTTLFAILSAINEEWAACWSRERYSVNTDQIMQSYCATCRAFGLELISRTAKEHVYQSAFSALVGAVEECLAPTVGSKLHWLDTHKTLILRAAGSKRSPDGVFVIAKELGAEFRNTVIAVEIKSGSHKHDSALIQGQLIQNFLDMAASQPRRFILGLALAEETRTVRLYVYISGQIFHVPVGCLPQPADVGTIGADGLQLIQFMAFLIRQVAMDYGLLTENKCGIFEEFSLSQVIGILPDSIWPHDSEYGICARPVEALGRHRALTGQRTWIYPAFLSRNKTDKVIFKFLWRADKESEIDIHRFISDIQVPYIPKLICSGEIQYPPGEILLMEDVGRPIAELFSLYVAQKAWDKITDVFAGYVHTLLAASNGEGGRFALHRDISMNNLLISEGNTPFIIDWGYGCIDNISAKRTASTYEKIGTAVYMGIRVLHGCGDRSVVDDLESLFLVFCHCLWESFGTVADLFTNMWLSGSTTTELMINHRIGWLGTAETFLASMKLKVECPDVLQRFALGMYNLLFPTTHPISSYHAKLDEERDSAKQVSEWLLVFEHAVGARHATGSTAMPCLQHLYNYADSISRDTVFVDSQLRGMSSLSTSDRPILQPSTPVRKRDMGRRMLRSMRSVATLRRITPPRLNLSPGQDISHNDEDEPESPTARVARSFLRRKRK